MKSINLGSLIAWSLQLAAGRGVPKGYRTINRLNRSRKWRSARDYKHARAISPCPERPVR